MHEHWMLIERRLAELGCLNEIELLPGASENEIADLEHHLGIVLPDSARQFLAIHNGQKGGFGLFYGQDLLSVTGIRQQWDIWRSIDEDEMNEDCADLMQSEPADVIKPMYCNRLWIPLTHDGSGNHLGLDFDPDTLGTSGQAIAFGRDEDTKRLIASTFEAFISSYVSWLERATWNGEYLDLPSDA